ncbi:hypothetical protein PRK78_005151 [Emydomyces testavorans]|uniref:Uncharacterized protein n=1 Tax=Emydomyces testavorans TaxID=2070801 RepID=A0AAF0DJ95_9EURO|nr:hypothetical protein PRK78_005151 [Emydomyces testavorans]
MSDKPAQTGVRSLLARFENNISTSPPSRGRSPIGTDGSGTVRPLSKVRASFIPVERNGSAGSPLGWPRRADSGDSLANTKPPMAYDFGGPIEKSSPLTPTEPIHKSFPGRLVGTAQMSEKKEPAGGLDTTTHNVPGDVIHGLGAILKGSPFEDSKPQKLSQKHGSSLQALSSAALEPKSTVMQETKTNNLTKGAAPKIKPETKTASSRPSNIAIAKEPNHHTPRNTVAKGPKTPPAQTPKFPVTPESQVPKAVNSSAVAKDANKASPRVNTPRRPGRSSLSPVARTKSAVATRENAANLSSKHNSPDHQKPRSKSPTRPIRLPSSMTAQTASSAAKTNNPASRPQSRNDINRLTRKPSSLRTDRATSKPPVPSTTIRTQPSRTSLAPPPNTALDRPKSRSSHANPRAPDESFLARMMRPTASSANKTHDKVEPKSPPRSARTARPVRKPADRNHAASNHAPKAKSPEPRFPEVKSLETKSPEAKLSDVKPLEAESLEGKLSEPKSPEARSPEANLPEATPLEEKSLAREPEKEEPEKGEPEKEEVEKGELEKEEVEKEEVEKEEPEKEEPEKREPEKREPGKGEPEKGEPVDEDNISQSAQEPESQGEAVEPLAPYKPEIPAVAEETPPAPAAEVKEPEAAEA